MSKISKHNFTTHNTFLCVLTSQEIATRWFFHVENINHMKVSFNLSCIHDTVQFQSYQTIDPIDQIKAKHQTLHEIW